MKSIGNKIRAFGSLMISLLFFFTHVFASDLAKYSHLGKDYINLNLEAKEVEHPVANRAIPLMGGHVTTQYSIALREFEYASKENQRMHWIYKNGTNSPIAETPQVCSGFRKYIDNELNEIKYALTLVKSSNYQEIKNTTSIDLLFKSWSVDKGSRPNMNHKIDLRHLYNYLHHSHVTPQCSFSNCIVTGPLRFGKSIYDDLIKTKGKRNFASKPEEIDQNVKSDISSSVTMLLMGTNNLKSWIQTISSETFQIFNFCQNVDKLDLQYMAASEKYIAAEKIELDKRDIIRKEQEMAEKSRKEEQERLAIRQQAEEEKKRESLINAENILAKFVPKMNATSCAGALNFAANTFLQGTYTTSDEASKNFLLSNIKELRGLGKLNDLASNMLRGKMLEYKRITYGIKSTDEISKEFVMSFGNPNGWTKDDFNSFFYETKSIELILEECSSRIKLLKETRRTNKFK